MRSLDKLRLRLRSLVHPHKTNAELDAELQFHLDHLTEENIAGGMAPAEAREAALRQIGGLTQYKEECRDMRRLNLIEDTGKDLRYGLRVLARAPGFTAVAVLTLALGIGATTAIFSVVKAVLLEPLAYNDSERIVAIQTHWNKTNRSKNVSGGDYLDLVAEPSPFTATTRYSGGELAVEVNGRAEFAAAHGVDAGFTGVFQLNPVAGRLLTADEFKQKSPLAMVSEGFAIRHFGSPGNALGQLLRIEERGLSIVGILPAQFHFPLKAEIWFPMPWENPNRTSGNYKALGLLKPGVAPEAARAHLVAVGVRLQLAFPSSHKDKSFTATPLRDLFVERSEMTLWLLMGSVGLLLLVACANVANLLLARATARSREMALRSALGAGGARLVRQLLVESALLGLAGGCIGLLIAFAGVDALIRMAPQNLPRLEEIRVDKIALLFNVGVSLGAALLFGLWPALRAARVDLHDAMKQGGTRGVLGGGRGEWMRGALVSAEVALALVLTLGAGLLFRSFLALNSVDLGYRTENRIVLTASIPAKTEDQHLQAGAKFDRMFAALRELPGVSGAAGVMGLPTGPYGSNGRYAVEGMHDFKTDPLEKMPQAGFRLTSPGYFSVMGVPLISGRDFNERDLFEAEPVAIVSATLARQVFGAVDPIGRRIKCGLDRDVWMRVVGIAGDMRNENPASPPAPELYMAYRQHPFYANELHVVVRAQGDLSAAARKTIDGISPGIPLKISTLENFHRESIALPRFRTLLLIVFAALAAALATAGVYGVMSYTAVQRQAEMGVRIALGASGADVVSLLVGSGAKLAAIGLICGLAIATLAGRFVESMLYGIRPQDPLTIAAALTLLTAAALMAALIPALRVARVDPALALRED